MWVIFGVHVRKYMNDKLGWVSGEDNATRYTLSEKTILSLHMPFGGVWQQVHAPATAHIGAGFRGA